MYVSSFLSFNLEYKYTTVNLPFFFCETVNLVLYSLFLNKIKQQQQQQQQ